MGRVGLDIRHAGRRGERRGDTGTHTITRRIERRYRRVSTSRSAATEAQRMEVTRRCFQGGLLREISDLSGSVAADRSHLQGVGNRFPRGRRRSRGPTRAVVAHRHRFPQARALPSVPPASLPQETVFQVAPGKAALLRQQTLARVLHRSLAGSGLRRRPRKTLLGAFFDVNIPRKGNKSPWKDRGGDRLARVGRRTGLACGARP